MMLLRGKGQNLRHIRVSPVKHSVFFSLIISSVYPHWGKSQSFEGRKGIRIRKSQVRFLEFRERERERERERDYLHCPYTYDIM